MEQMICGYSQNEQEYCHCENCTWSCFEIALPREGPASQRGAKVGGCAFHVGLGSVAIALCI